MMMRGSNGNMMDSGKRAKSMAEAYIERKDLLWKGYGKRIGLMERW
jgi:hypothetical protein